MMPVSMNISKLNKILSALLATFYFSCPSHCAVIRDDIDPEAYQIFKDQHAHLSRSVCGVVIYDRDTEISGATSTYIGKDKNGDHLFLTAAHVFRELTTYHIGRRSKVNKPKNMAFVVCLDGKNRHYNHIRTIIECPGFHNVPDYADISEWAPIPDVALVTISGNMTLPVVPAKIATKSIAEEISVEAGGPVSAKRSLTMVGWGKAGTHKTGAKDPAQDFMTWVQLTQQVPTHDDGSFIKSYA
ncbi:MAG: hypothetical protein J0G29_02905 [Alphaproteobacteria bacterium]|nr:hypothetical protein [Alphaproteobacteria bacterium]OJV46325.1 MAG: hypothetical protein BGO28_03095 [Alphaproteobacteria bacterium 43-37]